MKPRSGEASTVSAANTVTYDVQGVRYGKLAGDGTAAIPQWFAEAEPVPLSEVDLERIQRLIDPTQNHADTKADPSVRTLRFETPAAFPQRPGSLDALLGTGLSELPQQHDAFQVRVQGPVGATNAPVLVFIPGGGFLSGSGNARWFERTPLATNVVVVTVNYRVGALGHLSPLAVDAPEAVHAGNRGLRDVLLALRWVHAHIGAFGGDPSQVTLAGDSAGGWIARCIATMPAAAGLFQRLLMVSVPGTPPLTEAQQQQRMRAFLSSPALAGLDPASATTQQLLDAQQDVQAAVQGDGVPFAPVAEGEWLTAAAMQPDVFARDGVVNDVLILTTANEARAFLLSAPDQAFYAGQAASLLASLNCDPEHAAAVLATQAALTGAPARTAKQEFGDALTLAQFRLPALDLAARSAAHGKNAWLGQLNLQCGIPELGSPHCLLVPLLFGNPEQWSDAPILHGIPSPAFNAAQAAIQGLVLGFVAYGDPCIDGKPVPQVTTDDLRTVEISASGAVSSLETDANLRFLTPHSPDSPRSPLICAP